MNKILKKYKLPKQENVKIFEYSKSNYIESVLKHLLTKKALHLDSITDEFFDVILSFKENITSVLHNLFREQKKIQTLPNIFYEAIITQIPKFEEDIIRKENYSFLSYTNISTKMLKILEMESSAIQKGHTTTMRQLAQEYRVNTQNHLM